MLEVLPLYARYTGFDPVKAAAPAASDFKAMENLRRLALAEQAPVPKQLELGLAGDLPQGGCAIEGADISF